MGTKQRVDRWCLKSQTLSFGPLPSLMGILNVTPDSFSDGGRFVEASVAVEHGLQMVEQGAAILDVGGESTRPYSEPVSAHEELRRVLPVIERLAEQTSVPISIDTSKAVVAQEAISCGAEIINDVTGLSGDPDMLDVARETGVGVCVMHMRETPQTMQNDPAYGDVLNEITDYLAERRDALIEHGIVREKICLDPGIGFGKSQEHNLAILRHVGRLHKLGCPVLVGHSRKSFIGHVLNDMAVDREPGTMGASLAVARQGVQLLRLHDLRGVRQAMLLFEAAGGMDHSSE